MQQVQSISQLIAPPANPSLGVTTLDEPVWQTILRDLKQIGIKIFHVAFPRGKGPDALRDWDLWGPLVLCFSLAIVLRIESSTDQSLVFSLVFVLVAIGSIIVTLNAKALGGKISFFQSVCVIGYCLFPLNVASLLIIPYRNLIYRFIVVMICFAWATFAVYGFISGMVPPARKALAVYPAFLFYLILSWMLLNAT